MPRRLVVLLAALTVAVTACGSPSEPEPTPTPTEPPPQAEPIVTPEPEPTPTPTPTPEPVLAPLTGLEVDADEDLDRPVFAVKIDNNPKALPQDGLEQADVVFSELVEGGTTRFIALFHSTDPGEVGPVRSGREVDVDLMPAFQPVFGYSGAAAEVVGQLQRSGMLLVTEGDPGWSRRKRPGVAYEHTLYTDVATQWERGSDLPAATQPWALDAAPLTDGTEVDGMSLTYSRETTVSWQWDGEHFVRTQYGAPHVTSSGDQIAAANVVVPRVAVRPGPRGGGTVAIQVVGEGEAVVFRDGRSYEARWRKASAESHFEWLTPEGDPLPLAPGRTWVELVPSSGSVTTTPAAALR